MASAQTAGHYFKKKTVLYKERDELKRNEFRKALEAIDPRTIVYMDEAGIDNRLFREYARAPRGVKVYADIPGKKRERISLIGGWFQKKFIAPMAFKGGCNKDVLNAWLHHILLPDLPPGTTIIMDNAAFHKSSQTRELIQEAGCFLHFLPTYSPDLNPIEHCWHTLKSILRPWIQNGCDNLQEQVEQAVISMT